jgi:hypothetical protein
MANTLRATIEKVLVDVHIETGRKDDWEQVVSRLEAAIAEKIRSHEIDYYSVNIAPPAIKPLQASPRE